jgi:hypothetical protein
VWKWNKGGIVKAVNTHKYCSRYSKIVGFLGEIVRMANCSQEWRSSTTKRDGYKCPESAILLVNAAV